MSFFGITIITTKKFKQMEQSIQTTSEYLDSCIARLDQVLTPKAPEEDRNDKGDNF